MDFPIIINEGLRMWKRARLVKKHGIKRYPGSDEEICRQIVEDCWNEERKYFQVSAGHFKMFYTRDFSWVVKPLISQGYRDEVIQTLEYVLRVFSRHRRITTAINADGDPFDFPTKAIDSLPSLIHAIREANATILVDKYRKYLEHEVAAFFASCINKKTGFVRPDKYYSSIRDHAKRKGSCYDNCMVAMLAEDLDEIGLENPFENYDYPANITKFYWNNLFFREDARDWNRMSGDANVFPFWTGVVNDPEMFVKVMYAINQHRLDVPFPMRYETENKTKMNVYSHLAKGYETDSIWAHLGLIYIQVVLAFDIDMAEGYLRSYQELINKHKNFLEVYDAKGEPYKTRFYHTDEAMIWSVIYLDVKEHLKI